MKIKDFFLLLSIVSFISILFVPIDNPGIAVSLLILGLGFIGIYFLMKKK